MARSQTFNLLIAILTSQPLYNQATLKRPYSMAISGPEIQLVHVSLYPLTTK